MKHIPTTLAPALALLALASCATTNGLTTTEPDGVYYSSKDRTTQVATASTQPDASDYATVDDPDAVANPDYQTGRSNGSSSDAYYDEDFDYNYYARQRRYNGLGMTSYYNLGYATPYWYSPTFSYYDPFLYSYSPYYGYGRGWNDPFWGPSWYGSGVSISFGWGNWGGWGPWGGYGYRPWGYGYGYGGWDYPGYYGYGYGGGYYGGYYGGGYWNGYRGGSRNVSYRVAPRHDRSVEVVGANPAAGGGGRPRIMESTGGRSAGYDPGSGTRYSRGRVEDGAAVGGGRPGQQQTGTADVASPNGPGRGRMYRIVDSAPAGSPDLNPTGGVRPVPGQGGAEQVSQADAVQLQDARVNRRRFYNDQQPSLAPSGQPGQDAQPQQQYQRRRERYADANGSEQPQQYQQPSRPQRTYEAPQRSYEQPQRSYDGGGRSSGGGGSFGGGGGNSGGGGGGRGRVR